MTAHAIPKAAPVGAAAEVEFRHLPAGSALLTEMEWEQTAHALRLSGRELQIVRGVFDCRKEDAIAADLGITPRTIEPLKQRFAEEGLGTALVRKPSSLIQANSWPLLRPPMTGRPPSKINNQK